MPVSDDRIERIAARLLAQPQPVDDLDTLKPDWQPFPPLDRPPVEAAVLIALVARENTYSILYTERSSELRSHSGQIAFPGGKVDPGDADAGAAALREAEEEVGLNPDDVHILGFMPPYFTGTNYLITPVIAVARPTQPYVLNPLEVQTVFEVPLARIANSETYGTFRLRHGKVEHTTWQIDHEGFVIWGITANLTRRFRDLALDGDEVW